MQDVLLNKTKIPWKLSTLRSLLYLRILFFSLEIGDGKYNYTSLLNNLGDVNPDLFGKYPLVDQGDVNPELFGSYPLVNLGGLSQSKLVW
jgi:hypothetical protein